MLRPSKRLILALGFHLIAAATEPRALSDSISPLKTFWSEARKDSYTAGTREGWGAATRSKARYSLRRQEGFVFKKQTPGTVPLSLFWHSGRGDHILAARRETLDAVTKAGYTFVRVEGYAFSSPRPGTRPLKQYWHSGHSDNGVAATDAGTSAFRKQGYSYARTEAYILEKGGSETRDTGFLPAKHGFRFGNSFRIDPALVGQPQLKAWDLGFCGGMCLSALRRWQTGQPVPPLTAPPRQQCPELELFWELSMSQTATLYPDTWGLVLAWQLSPALTRGGLRIPRPLSHGSLNVGKATGTANLTVEHEWPRIKESIDRGQPSIACLIRVPYTSQPQLQRASENHQVLVVGYTWDVESGDIELRVYDPNHPGRTEKLRLNQDPASWSSWCQSSGEAFRGFFKIDV